MKKLLVLLVALIGFMLCANAEKVEVPIIKDGKEVGKLTYEILKFTPHNKTDGGFLTMYLYNDSDENISVIIKGKKVSGPCSAIQDLGPYKKIKDFTFACSDNVSELKVTVTVNYR